MKDTAVHRETDQSQRFKAWWKKNWKKVIAGVVIVGGTILVIKNWDEIIAFAEKLAVTLKPEAKIKPPVAVPKVVEEIDVAPVLKQTKEIVRKPPGAPFGVTAHIRTLPEGWHASPEKIAEAAELQIVLLPNQTLVDAYTKGIKVA